MKTPLEIQLEERCLGQITRNLVSPEITKDRGDCKICEYDAQENPKCKAYYPIAFRIFEVVE